MTELTITARAICYDHAAELPEAEAALLQAATQALQKAYAPYSGFRVGAALLLADGTIETGANQENAAYPMCLCAEQVALAAAAAHKPSAAPVMMAVTAMHSHKPIGHPAAPCGACRQVLAEWETRFGQPIAILLKGETGPVYYFQRAKDLLPLAFDGSFL